MRTFFQTPWFTFLVLVGIAYPRDFVAAQRTSEVETKVNEYRPITEPTKLTLITAGTDLDAVLADIQAQTGNKLVDFRERFGQDVSQSLWNFSISDRDFWPVLDKFLDAADLGLYAASGEDALAVVNRTPDSLLRFGRACYSGPFRIEATNITARKGLRNPRESSAQLELEVAWEPRLNPISFSLAKDTLEITADDQTMLTVEKGVPVIGAEVLYGTHTAEMVVPLQLPPRQIRSLMYLKGQLIALVPAGKTEFRFTDLPVAADVEQIWGGVKVVLVDVIRKQSLWELRMRLEVVGKVQALQKYRGWAFQNRTYLENPEGEVVDHAGFETIGQSEGFLSLAYFFDLPVESLQGYTWVYHTPADITELPVEIELKDLPLP
ncbi:hypothetical protein [Bythopirellula polymerisocia]|uniref:Uncharacterized protein n=1 Tax=Bythopirellula polymerisocia TaxID=2528003 RepID=A0A5C6D237_9BACT|nr:hypothetical protein [Bythopirellula polymerisocia]TWU29717.1 hypothetical protein Pla144_04960 [Bythopirellula polymerisocia]